MALSSLFGSLALSLSAQPRGNMKSWFLTLLKISITLGLLYWSYLQGHWDIHIFYRLPEMAGSFIAAFLTLCLLQLVVSLRWFAMIEHFITPKGIKPFLISVKIVLVSNFFNTFLPGSIAGDMLRANYRMELDPKLSKKVIWLTSLADRFMGLFGLLFLGGLGAIIYQWHPTSQVAMSVDLSATSLTAFYSLLVLLEWGCIGLTLCYLMLWLPARWRMMPWKALGHYYPLSKEWLQMIDVMMCRARLTFPLSLIVHLLVLLVLALFAPYSLEGNYHWVELICAQSIGMVIASIPLAPGGAGVGHVAFNWTFSAMGMKGGANLFNLFLMLLYLNSCLGLLFFVFKKNKKIIHGA